MSGRNEVLGQQLLFAFRVRVVNDGRSKGHNDRVTLLPAFGGREYQFLQPEENCIVEKQCQVPSVINDDAMSLSELDVHVRADVRYLNHHKRAFCSFSANDPSKYVLEVS